MPTYVSFQQEQQLVIRLLLREKERARRTHYYLETAIFPTNTVIPVTHDLTATQPTIMIFADDQPEKNWTHPCRFLFFHATSLQFLGEMSAQLPPYFFNPTASDSFLPFYIEHPLPPPAHKPYFVLPRRKPKALGNRYAVLYSGRSNYCHVNDLGFMHQTLIQYYGYDPANIKVLNYDGVVRVPSSSSSSGSLSTYASHMPIHGAATKSIFKSTVHGFAYTPEDSLLIFTTNHGALSTGPYLFGYLDDSVGNGITTDEFADILQAIPVRFRSLMVIMQQCFAGGFIAPILSRTPAVKTSVATAAPANEVSTSGTDFNPYSKHWISAMAGIDPFMNSTFPNPDLNLDSRITMEEAHNFAVSKLLSDSIGDKPKFDQLNNGKNDVLGEKP